MTRTSLASASLLLASGSAWAGLVECPDCSDRASFLAFAGESPHYAYVERAELVPSATWADRPTVSCRVKLWASTPSIPIVNLIAGHTLAGAARAHVFVLAESGALPSLGSLTVEMIIDAEALPLDVMVLEGPIEAPRERSLGRCE